MRRGFFSTIIVSCLFISLVFMACGPEAPKTIKIGVNAPITGVVLNQFNVRDAERQSDYDHYGGYYGYAESGTGTQKPAPKPHLKAASF